jgi:WD40 repeat protein
VFGFFQTFLSYVFLRVFGRLALVFCLRAPQAKNVKRVQFPWILSKRWTGLARAIALAILTIAQPLHAEPNCHDLMAALNISESNAQLTARLAEFYHDSVLTSPDAEHIRRHMKGLYEGKLADLANAIGTTPETLHKEIKNHIDKKRGEIVTPRRDKLAPLAGPAGNRIKTHEWKQIGAISFPKGTIFNADFSPDGERVITAHSDKTARLSDAAGNLISEFEKHPSSVSSAIFAPRGKIITVSEGTARVWDENTQQLVRSFEPPLFSLNALFDFGQMSQLRISEDGKQIVSFSPDLSRVIRFWDIEGKLKQTLSTSPIPFIDITALHVNADGDKMVVAAFSNRATLWERGRSFWGKEKWKISRVFRGPYGDDIIDTSINNAGTHIATLSSRGVHLWDKEGKSLAIWAPRKDSGRLSTISFSPDGKTLLSFYNSAVTVLQNLEGQELSVIKGPSHHDVWGTHPLFSRDGNRLLIFNAYEAQVWERQWITLEGMKSLQARKEEK